MKKILYLCLAFMLFLGVPVFADSYQEDANETNYTYSGDLVSATNFFDGSWSTFFDLSGTIGYQYQENATEIYATDTNPAHYTSGDHTSIYDGNWNTGCAISNPYTPSWYFNYTKPEGSTNNSLWQIREYNGSYVMTNLTVPANCWDYDENKLMFRYEQYLNKNSYHYSGDVYVISTESNYLIATGSHEFYVDGVFVLAEDLEVGMKLLNSELQFESIRDINIEHHEGYVYDLTVEDNKNFFANDILVHNQQSYTRWSCYNGTWNIIRNSEADNLFYGYEEAMWWEVYSLSEANFYSNYTVPDNTNLSASLWSWRDGQSLGNFTLDSECTAYSEESGKLVLGFRTTEDSVSQYRFEWRCWNSTDWVNLRNYCCYHIGRGTEEGIYWVENIQIPEETGYTPIQASIIGIVTIVIALGTALIGFRTLTSEGVSMENIIAVLLGTIVVIIFIGAIMLML